MKYKTEKAVLFASSILLLSQFGSEHRIRKSYSVVENMQSIEDYSESPEVMKTRVLNKYFTDEAFEVLKQIPVVVGETVWNYEAHATGRNVVINTAEYVLGFGFGRKTVIADEHSVTEQLLLHEYVHHASAVGLIDDELFSVAWEQMANDSEYNMITKSIDNIIEQNYPGPLMFCFPKWKLIERESKLAEKIVFENVKVPGYVKNVYSSTLR